MNSGGQFSIPCDYIRESGEHEFGTVKTTPQAIHDLIVGREPQRVVMEPIEKEDSHYGVGKKVCSKVLGYAPG